MRDRPRFVEGGLYRYRDIAAQTFIPGGLHEHNSPVTIHPDTIFRREGTDFVELVESADPLVSSQKAQIAIEKLRDHGWTFRRIGRECGLSLEAVHRCASGVGRIRTSTEDAVVQVSSALNGQR